MSDRSALSRRQFVAGASTGMLLAGAAAGTIEKAVAADAPKLAVQGGEKAVKAAVTRPPRWGDAEQEQLGAMLKQSSLFYWQGKGPGPQTQALVDRFQQFCPRKWVHTCSSGTAALHIATAAAGIGPGDEVITSPVTDIGTVIGTIYQQGVPVFADLGPGTWNLDPADVEKRITPKTKAIIAVHLTGNPCNLDALKAIADRHKLILIEDCAQAWGAKYHGKPIGTVGHIACFSLQDTKHITCGDGGVVASSDERFGPSLQKFGDKGVSRLDKRIFRSFATNYRMSEPQAAVVAGQLTRLEAIAAKRAKLGNLLTEKIKHIPGIIPHEVHPEDRAVYWFYFFRPQYDKFRCDRSAFVKALVAEGVSGVSGGYIGVPLYGESIFQEHAFFNGRWPVREFGLTTMDYTKHRCPEAEAILKTGIRIVLHEGMTEEYVLEAAAAIEKVARHYSA